LLYLYIVYLTIPSVGKNIQNQMEDDKRVNKWFE